MSLPCPTCVLAKSPLGNSHTLTPLPGIDGLVSSIESACIATRGNKSSIPPVPDGSGWPKVRPKCRPKSHTSEAPIRRADGAHSPPSPFRITYMRDPSTAGDREPFFCRCLTLSPPNPLPPSRPPSRPAVRQRPVSRQSLELPVFPNASLTALRRLLSTHARSVPSPCPCLPGPSASQPAPILPVRRRPHASRNAHACLGCLADYSAR